MDTQKNLKVLQQYYVSVIRGIGALSYGASYHHMVDMSELDPIPDGGVDCKALIGCLAYLQDKGFSDLYLNGRRKIGIYYGAVPFELEVCFTLDKEDEVNGFKIEMFIRYNKRVAVSEFERSCGRWHWDKDVGLVTDAPVDMNKVIWGAKGR